jgi:hypothetical protein
MRSRSVYIVCGLAFSGLATAQSTCDTETNSHSDQIACEIKQSQQRSQDVDHAFADLMATNTRFNHLPGTKSDLFTKWLTSDQAQWRAFTAQDCSLQGEVSLGTAASDIEQQCLQDAYAHRIEVLRQMANILPH